MRNNSIDIAKGICIIMMIFGHCPDMPRMIYSGIESFHMPFFFIASGLFFRPKEISQVVLSGLRRLVYPLLIGTLVCVLICMIMGNEQSAWSFVKAILYPGGTRNKDILLPHWPCLGVFWFLAALFWCRLLYTMIDKYIQKYRMLICFVLSWFTIIIARRLMLPFGISEGMSGLIFYAFGRYISSHSIYDIKVPWYGYVLFLIAWMIDIHFIHFQMFQCSYVWYLYPIGVFFACGMGKVVYEIAKVLKDNKGYWLQYIGFFGLEVMCCHQVIRTLLDNLKRQNDTYTDSLIFSSVLIIGTLILSIGYISIKSMIDRKQ